ncbi:MAG: ABC transporter ATP-binding protein [Hahellaceae bacterium]|nr:ABC transporter ATP-binding protein [Hahellaceae bacterium]
MLRIFERWITPFPEQSPNQPPNGLLAFCLYYSRGVKSSLFVMTLLTALMAIMEVSLFRFLGELVDWLSAHQPDTFLQEEGKTLLAWSALVLIGLPVVVFLHAAVVHQALLGNYPMRVRWLAHRYLLRQSLSFYQNDFAGRIATKVMQTALSLRESVMKTLDVILYVFIYFISMLVVIAEADVRLIYPMLVWFAVYVLLQLYFVPRLKRVSTEQADARAVMTGRIVDSYTNITTVKLFSHTQREADYAREGMDGFLQTVYRQMRLATGINVSVHVLNYVLVFAIAAEAIVLWIDSAISVGAIAVAISLALRLNGMSQWIMWEVTSLFENIGTVADGMHTLAQPEAVADRPEAGPLKVQGGLIEFTNVGFHYGKGSGVIEGLNLTLQPGEKVGLVGRSGAGKSTLVNLLMRFHDLETGQIRIDGQNIAEVTQDSLRHSLGMVTQDTSLLHRSVRDNLLYGRPEATEAEMIEAARRAEAHDFILGLTDPHGHTGYDAQVGERGVKLSGGQRQRIAIARVLLKDAPILILDEATSALDSEVETAIQENLMRLMKGKTVLAIAHRLSTIAAMDRLIVIDHGQIVEQGSHAELIRSGGLYAQLWTHQTGGFLGVDTNN